MVVALGVPHLILPSLCDVSEMLWGLCVVVWVVSVLQGFAQNLAYGEMSTCFPNAIGLPGCAQEVFTDKNDKSKYNKGKFIGAFCAWCYWFAWTPVVMIFGMLISDYLVRMLSLDISGWAYLGLYVGIMVLILILMYILGSRGLENGAKMSMVLAIVSIVPMVVILIGAYVTGLFDFGTITSEFTGPAWTWNGANILLLLGGLGLAQWSACGWENAAIYGPQYKNPAKDVPKALFACGFICLILYFFVSFSAYGALGHEGISDAGVATLVPISIYVFGEAGSYVALALLIVAMILIVQTGFIGSSMTLQSMADEKNMPRWFGQKNKNNMPTNAMIFVSVFNLLLVIIIGFSSTVLGSSESIMTILAAGSIGYAIANGIALAAHFKMKTSAKFKDIDSPFKLPKAWKYISLAMVIVQIVYIPALIYWSYMVSGGFIATIVGVVVLACYIPVWVLTQNKCAAESACTVES
jgi:amino acid transporter